MSRCSGRGTGIHARSPSSPSVTKLHAWAGVSRRSPAFRACPQCRLGSVVRILASTGRAAHCVAPLDEIAGEAEACEMRDEADSGSAEAE